uniref:Uncharacterized protein n=1 Tax=Arundo donax TaxID=35708 RepID=A0A0A9BR48_ARUDO
MNLILQLTCNNVINLSQCESNLK